MSDVSVSAWCLRSEGVSSVLLGVSNTEQLMENLGSIGVRSQARRPSASFWPGRDAAPADVLSASPAGPHAADSTPHRRDGCVAGEQTQRSQERDQELRRTRRPQTRVKLARIRQLMQGLQAGPRPCPSHKLELFNQSYSEKLLLHHYFDMKLPFISPILHIAADADVHVFFCLFVFILQAACLLRSHHIHLISVSEYKRTDSTLNTWLFPGDMFSRFQWALIQLPQMI